MRSSRRIGSDDGGETLIEMLVSITILAVIGVVLASGITVSVLISDQHRKETLESAYLHDYAEALQSSYTNCASPATYSLASPPAGYSITVSQILYWNGSTAFQSTCGTDAGLQQITLAMVSSNNLARESLTFVLRRTS